MNVKLIDHMGSDLSVVNAARVSFNKKVEVFDEERDAKLIRYLARHNHWTPFGHTAVTLHIKAPIFVARQLGKHQVGLVWNEVSRRYVDDEPELYSPDKYRGRADNVKQGSGDTRINLSAFSISGDSIHDSGWEASMEEILYDFESHCIDVYTGLLNSGVCPEQARMVLPQSMYTEWYWTGNIAAFARVCNLRLDPHTQKETQDIAQQISDTLGPLFPVSWEALVDE